MKEQAHIISASSFALICLLFLLPFANLECGNQKIFVVSGVQLATGFRYNVPSLGEENEKSQSSGPNMFALAALLASVLGVILSMTSRRNRKNLKVFIIALSLVTGISLLAMQFDLNSKIAEQTETIMVRFNFEIGYWLCLLAAIGLIVFALVVLNEPLPTQQPPSANPDTGNSSIGQSKG